jgi:hypothetical protein
VINEQGTILRFSRKKEEKRERERERERDRERKRLIMGICSHNYGD